MGASKMPKYDIPELKEFFDNRMEQIQQMILTLEAQKRLSVELPKPSFQNFPLKTVAEVNQLSSMMVDPWARQEVETEMCFAGGQDIHKSVYSILKKIFSPELSLQYSALGKRGKESFAKLLLYDVLKGAVRRKFPEATDVDIQKSVIKFFVSAKDRAKKFITS